MSLRVVLVGAVVFLTGSMLRRSLGHWHYLERFVPTWSPFPFVVTFLSGHKANNITSLSVPAVICYLHTGLRQQEQQTGGGTSNITSQIKVLWLISWLSQRFYLVRWVSCVSLGACQVSWRAWTRGVGVKHGTLCINMRNMNYGGQGVSCLVQSGILPLTPNDLTLSSMPWVAQSL